MAWKIFLFWFVKLLVYKSFIQSSFVVIRSQRSNVFRWKFHRHCRAKRFRERWVGESSRVVRRFGSSKTTVASSAREVLVVLSLSLSRKRFESCRRRRIRICRKIKTLQTTTILNPVLKFFQIIGLKTAKRLFNNI